MNTFDLTSIKDPSPASTRTNLEWLELIAECPGIDIEADDYNPEEPWPDKCPKCGRQAHADGVWMNHRIARDILDELKANKKIAAAHLDSKIDYLATHVVSVLRQVDRLHNPDTDSIKPPSFWHTLFREWKSTVSGILRGPVVVPGSPGDKPGSTA